MMAAAARRSGTRSPLAVDFVARQRRIGDLARHGDSAGTGQLGLPGLRSFGRIQRRTLRRAGAAHGRRGRRGRLGGLRVVLDGSASRRGAETDEAGERKWTDPEEGLFCSTGVTRVCKWLFERGDYSRQFIDRKGIIGRQPQTAYGRGHHLGPYQLRATMARRGAARQQPHIRTYRRERRRQTGDIHDTA